jgi:hypothetical protein
MVVNPSAGESSLSVSILPTQTTACLSQFIRSSCEAAIDNRDTIRRKWVLNQRVSNLTMTNRSIGLMSLLGILSTWIYPHQVAAQTATGTIKNNPTTYEDDKIKVVIQDCNRKLQDLICQATLTSKNSDRPIDLNSTNIKLIDAEGNEYYPSSLRLANRTSTNNSIKAELIENVPFKASFIFGKIPASVTRIALFQMPIGGINATAKFRNLLVVEPNSPKAVPIAAAILPVKSPKVSSESSKDNSLICPDNTKILYRATSKHYRMYICGNQNPTHYVGHSKDGSEGITLRLRYYDRSRFSADNGDTNYTIAANKLIISKDSKVIYQEKIEVTQPLPGTVAATEEAPAPVKKSKKTATVTEEPTPIKTKPKKTTTPEVTTSPKRKSTDRSTSTNK